MRWRPTAVTALLLAAAALLGATLLRPGIPGTRAAYDFLFVVDISQSMLVRDQLDARGQPQARLDAARTALLQSVRDLPCGSRVGVGLFTGWSSAIAFRPIEVCDHRNEITTVLRNMDWRMTWVPQSNIARGLHNTLAEIARWSYTPTLVFVTDGDEAPPVDPDRRPRPPVERGSIAGLVAGVGATTPSPVPKHAISGAHTGYFETGGETLMSKLESGYLRDLAGAAGLDYMRLSDPTEFNAGLRRSRYARDVATQRGISWLFAALALALLLARYLVVPHVKRLHPIHARRLDDKRLLRDA